MQPLIDTLSALIRVNSINPAYAQGNVERHIQDVIGAFFRRRDIGVREQEVLPDRPNLIATIPGRNPNRRLILEAHCDTAGIESMDAPFDPIIANNRIHGRGACDTKGGLAAMMHAIADVHASGTKPPCEVWFVSAMDEEHSCQGSTFFCRDVEAAGAVIAEPTELRLIRASKGLVRWNITITGKAAHSAKPHLGVSAILGMARLLLELERDNEALNVTPHPLLGGPTWNAGQINGGTQVNIVPERCTISIDRRMIPGETPAQVLAGFQQTIDRVSAAHPEMKIEMEPPMLSDFPLDTSETAGIVQQTAAVLRELGLPDTPEGVPYGSDASKFGRAGVPAIIFGPGNIAHAHTPHEYLDLDQLEKAYLVYRRLIETFE
ncbi:MAG: M20 family metallopeptidase [Acidobacteria bacterium]|nr:M20 family metallopeptidase [Acidobacteriota bacterium]